MYSKWFYITDAVWNNAFSFDERDNKKLFVPELKKINSFDEIELQDDKSKVAFEDFWFDDKLSTNYWLKNFYEFSPPARGELEGGIWSSNEITAPIFLFDNHNHALYFWYLARDRWLIKDENILYHVDEHADTRDPGEYLLKPDSYDLKKVFGFTNFSKVNVGNYIIPAQKEWLIKEVIQIRNESNLQDYLKFYCHSELDSESLLWYIKDPETSSGWQNLDWFKWSIILNLDLDFFQPDLDFIDYELKKKVVLDIAKKANVITVASSPFFIDQELAIKVFKDLFEK